MTVAIGKKTTDVFLMKVNGRIPEIKDHNVGGDEAQPMYQSHDHRRVHENVAEDLLAIQSENQFQVSTAASCVSVANKNLSIRFRLQSEAFWSF